MATEEEDEAPEYDPAYFIPEPPLPQGVRDAWERKRRRQQSVKDAITMWQPILENYREYSRHLTFVPWCER